MVLGPQVSNTLNIFDKEYEIDILPENIVRIIQHIDVVSGDMQKLEFDLERVSFTRRALLDLLKAEMDRFDNPEAE